VSLALVTAFASWTTWYVRSHADQFAGISLDAASAGPIAGLYLLFAAMAVINGLLLRESLTAFHIELEPPEWLSLTAISYFANYFLPGRAGAGLRALYLIRRYDLAVADFLIVFGVILPMQMAINGILALVGMGVAGARSGVYDVLLIFFFGTVATCGAAFFAIGMRAPQSPADTHGFPWNQLQRLRRGLDKIRRDRSLFDRLWLLSALMAALTVAQVKLAFFACGHALPWSAAAVYAGSKNVASLASLTPGSLGIVEAMSIYLGRVLSYSTAQALVVQGVIRGVAISSIMVAAPFAYWAIRSRLRGTRDETAET